MKKSNLKLKINEITGDYEVIHNGFSWVSYGRRPYIIIRKKAGNKYVSTYRPLYSDLKKRFTYTADSIVTTLSGYMAFGKLYDFKIILTAKTQAMILVNFQ